MVLQEDGPPELRLERAAYGSCRGVRFPHFLVIVHRNSIQLDCHPRPRCPLAILVELRVRIVHVVGLPCQGRQAHVQFGGCDRINSPTLIHQSLESEGIEHLCLPATLVVDSAVPTTLRPGMRTIRGSKLDVDGAVPE